MNGWDSSLSTCMMKVNDLVEKAVALEASKIISREFSKVLLIPLLVMLLTLIK